MKKKESVCWNIAKVHYFFTVHLNLNVVISLSHDILIYYKNTFSIYYDLAYFTRIHLVSILDIFLSVISSLLFSFMFGTVLMGQARVLKP